VRVPACASARRRLASLCMAIFLARSPKHEGHKVIRKTELACQIGRHLPTENMYIYTPSEERREHTIPNT
jgi:hypothetical protein